MEKEKDRIVATSMASVAYVVCAIQGHKIGVLEYPGRTVNVNGYESEQAPGYDIRCTACGMTLEEIRKSGE